MSSVTIVEENSNKQIQIKSSLSRSSVCLFCEYMFIYSNQTVCLAKMFAMMLHSPLEETDSHYFTVYNIYKDFIICGSEGKEIKEHENKTDTSMYFLSVTINYSSLANIFLVQ